MVTFTFINVTFFGYNQGKLHRKINCQYHQSAMVLAKRLIVKKMPHTPAPVAHFAANKLSDTSCLTLSFDGIIHAEIRF